MLVFITDLWKFFLINSGNEFLVHFLHFYGVPFNFLIWSLIEELLCYFSFAASAHHEWDFYAESVVFSHGSLFSGTFSTLQLVLQSHTFCVFSSTSKTSGLHLKGLYPCGEMADTPGERGEVCWTHVCMLPSSTEFWLLKCYLSVLISSILKELLSIFEPGL